MPVDLPCAAVLPSAAVFSSDQSPPSTIHSSPIHFIHIALPPLPSSSSTNLHPMITRSKFSGPSASLSLSSSLYTDSKPPTYQAALTSPVWFEAMKDEFGALQKQHTWSLVPLPSHKNQIGCKWVFKIKRNSDGSIARYKARLVAKGYLQQEGIDFQETFSPVAKLPTIRIILCLALHHHWPLKQLDISNAFLHGKLEEEVFMTQPPGFVDSSVPTHVCKLHKALYGLKQAPRAWYSTFSTFLISQGFHNSHCDSSLFVHKTPHSITILVVYVDDILLTDSDSSHIHTLVAQMYLAFSMKELGNLSYFLGISVQTFATHYFLS